jgi:hypothetical protein
MSIAELTTYGALHQPLGRARGHARTATSRTNWTDKMGRKMQASKEVWGKIFGSISIAREVPR